MIKIYNSLTKQIEEFVPIKENEVSMYVCGPTVYDSMHIGNSRPVIFFDTVARFFRYRGYKVTYASNYTDIDDKIIARAQKEGVSEVEISERYIAEINATIRKLNCLPLSKTPRVTETIPEIIAFIAELVDRGAAYVADGDVYFDIGKVAEYGILSGQSASNLISGARIDPGEKKRNPLDFTLWKRTTEGRRWPSPWGEGRPGWHTECVVMIESIFQGKIDIHGGGNDLKFPHHDNEIAQSLSLRRHPIANYWMHNGMIDFSGEKMSKSLGNFVRAEDLLSAISYPVYRLMILNAPYRQPLSFRDELLEQAEKDYQKIYRSYLGATRALELNETDVEAILTPEIAAVRERFIAAMEDDFNTANALTEIQMLVKEINALIRGGATGLGSLKGALAVMKELLWVFGIEIEIEPLTAEDKAMVATYYKAKKEKDYRLSDQLRAIIIEKGIIL
jgi:cysteinyl-tRNA synthetase